MDNTPRQRLLTSQLWGLSVYENVFIKLNDDDLIVNLEMLQDWERLSVVQEIVSKRVLELIAS